MGRSKKLILGKLVAQLIKRFQVEQKLFIVLLLFMALAGSALGKDSFALYTDRDMYSGGETLMLKVFTPLNEQTGVVTIDLVNSSGKKITGIKLEIIDHQANGYIHLPDSLSSGFYLLRTLTRSATLHTMKELYIANRFSTLSGQTEILRPHGEISYPEMQTASIQINGLSKVYKKREKGIASLQLPDELLSRIDGNIQLSLAKVVSELNTRTFIVNTKLPPGPIIEKEGIILDGIVTDLKSDLPFKGAAVYLSIPDSIPGFQYFITGADGRFYFQLKNCYGKIPLVVQCLDPLTKRLLKIRLIDSEELRSGLPAYKMSAFPVDMTNQIVKLTETLTIRKIFNQPEIKIQPTPSTKHDTYPFYGIPTNIVYPKLFIDLPDFNEVSRELLPGVKFRSYNRMPTLEVINSATRNFFANTPLLLLDGIPIQDLNLIIKLGSKNIDRVEICQDERFYGDLTFPGVVAIYSSKGSNVKIPESEELIKLNLDGIQTKAVLISPSDPLSPEPDLRNILLWKPSVSPAGTLPIDFQTSDIKGTFKLVVRGKTKDGAIFFKEQIFEVN